MGDRLSDDALFERASCSALVITCSDFRFKSAERAFAESLGLRDDYDLIARPGAIRSLVAPRNEAARETMQEEIAMLWKLHSFGRVIMANHTSCGAYTDLVAHEDEGGLHRRHLAAAGREIRAPVRGRAGGGVSRGVGGRGAARGRGSCVVFEPCVVEGAAGSAPTDSSFVDQPFGFVRELYDLRARFAERRRTFCAASALEA